ncbi:HAMP domain-containing protein [Halieaceae bacterium IMCC14734]|uniref:histidine kinase n=1 Tax=Candidatus Litorirhabdus singularis TaxID=2518993 RepID=A0ABT3TID8_9GAMM|nr:ATP-binding protein [Candidatus Litorirhabdus singularis]MCX2982090.1 HAMP domain-containing protein [Candidatus Litorirhabdus singularis]
MLNLFTRIFLAIWLAMIAITGSWMLAARYFSPDVPELSAAETPRDFDYHRGPPDANRGPKSGEQRPPEHLRPRSRQVMETETAGHADKLTPRQKRPHLRPPRETFRILYSLQNAPEASLQDTLERIEQKSGLQVFLFNTQQQEIFGRSALPGTKDILNQLQGYRRRAAIPTADYTLFGQEIYRPQRGQLTVVIAARPPASALLRVITEHLWLRLLLAVLISGLISYAVARYLTRPLRQLQQASQQLAQGALDTRIPVPISGGGETSALGRSFNSMAAQLQEQIETQQRLLRDVSHELRSPLARMRVALALGETSPQQAAKQMQRLEKEVTRLDELVGQLLAVPAGRLVLEDSIDLVGLLTELCEDIGFEAASSNKACRFTTSLEEAVVLTHTDLLKKAFENVTRNALTYTAPHSTIEVALERDGDAYQVTVTDQGQGIPEAALEHIFEAFYRVDDARQRETGGYGLGLSIASRAVHQHGGSIRAENTGSGLRVTLLIPA